MPVHPVALPRYNEFFAPYKISKHKTWQRDNNINSLPDKICNIQCLK